MALPPSERPARFLLQHPLSLSCITQGVVLATAVLKIARATWLCIMQQHMQGLPGRKCIGQQRGGLIVPDNHNPLIHARLQERPVLQLYLHPSTAAVNAAPAAL